MMLYFAAGLLLQPHEIDMKMIEYIDLFCGIGGFRLAMREAVSRTAGAECVFSSDIDEECRKSYLANFGETPRGDITALEAAEIPDHDILLAGFPCQPFSIIGQMRGFDDTRGTPPIMPKKALCRKIR